MTAAPHWSLPGLPGLPAPGRCLVMGVLNVTPDSFSDGGRWLDPAAAVAHGEQLVADGADLVDVGGESTRPGARRVDAVEEQRRVVPVIRELTAAGVVVSVDTMRASTAAAALDAGAVMVNDVSGGLADPELPRLVGSSGAAYVAMHWRGHSEEMTRLAAYDDVVADVIAELSARLEALAAAGVDLDRVVVDPGIGFAKTAEHNWSLLAALPEFGVALGRPVLVGASRKSFLGRLLVAPDGTPRPMPDRDVATAAISALVAAAGTWGVRVHDAAGSADAVRVAAALAGAAASPGELSAGKRAGARCGADRPGTGVAR